MTNYYSFDLGTTHWRICQLNGPDDSSGMIREPQPLLLTIVDPGQHSLSATLLLDRNGRLLSCGAIAYEEITRLESAGFDALILCDAFKLCIGNQQEVVANHFDRRYSHQEALNYTHQLLLKIVECLGKEKPHSLTPNSQFVFTHPVHWGKENSQGEISGEILNDFALIVRDSFPKHLSPNIHFVAEPEAALVSLIHSKQLIETKGYTLIVDIGGGTTDLVSGKWAKNELGDIRSSGSNYGGNYFDEKIAQFIATKMNLDESQQLSLDKQLRYYGRKFKENISHQARVNYNQPVNLTVVLASPTENNILRQPISLNCAEFEKIAIEGKENLRNNLLTSLAKMELENRDIGQIVLVGGGARLFIVPNILREMFGDSVPIIYGDPPESTVARGAALWGVPKQLLISEPKKEGDEYAKIARENLRQQKYQQAIEGFTEVIQENPTNVPAFFNRGQARYQKGDIQGAINDWSQVVIMNPNDAYASYQLGVALLKKEDYQAAVMNFNQALSLNPQLADAYLERGIAKYYLGQQEQATKDFNQAVHISPGIVQIRLQDLKKSPKKWFGILSINSDKRTLEGLIQILETILGYKEPKTPIDSWVEFIQTKLPQEPEVISVMTYKAVVEFFVTERPSFSEIQKGAILRHKHPKKQGLFVVYQVFLDGNSELVCRQDNGIPFGRKVLVKNFDEELSDSFQNKDLLIFE